MTGYKGLLPVVMAVLLGACATAPVQQMSDARLALQEARKAGAAQRVPQEYDRAKALLQRAEVQLQVGGYDSARRLAEAARRAALKARDDALRQTAPQAQ